MAAWISQRLGRLVGRQLGWTYLRRLGARLRVPRPRHVQADPQAVTRAGSCLCRARDVHQGVVAMSKRSAIPYGRILQHISTTPYYWVWCVVGSWGGFLDAARREAFRAGNPCRAEEAIAVKFRLDRVLG